MHIGHVRISTPFVLAPMEEHTNPPFRLLMRQFGASLLCTERIDSADVAKRDRRAMRLLETAPGESPCAGQISGADPKEMAEAARVVEERGFAIVDLNFECPIKRLLSRGEGGALLADPAAIGRIVAAVVRAVSIPVTLKIRTGPDAERKTFTDVARAAEEAGAAAVDLHARSVQQGYVGEAVWSAVARLKQAVSIPVLGSGSVRTPADAVRFLRETGADGVAIGRGCLGNPWLFKQSREQWQSLTVSREPSPADRGRAVRQLVEGEFRYYGQTVALRRLARTSCYFAKFLPSFDVFKKSIHAVTDLAAFRRLVQEHFR